jgi:short-subunit dehydrogenase
MPKAIIIGATSGLGLALAEQLAQKQWTLGLTGRRTERLDALKSSLKTTTHIQTMDVSQPATAIAQLEDLIQRMGGLDLLIISAGISHRNANWEQESAIIQINALGFAAMAHTGFSFFMQQGFGHIVGISSISAIRGRAENISYSATKAFVSNYLQGLRQKAMRSKKNITITDILAGWVNTPLIRGGGSKRFWVATVDLAASQIITAIQKKKSRAYVIRRWKIIAWFLTLIPDWWHKRL